MNSKCRFPLAAALCILFTPVNPARGSALTDQGRLSDAGAPANRGGDLTFAFFNVTRGAGQVGNTPSSSGTAQSNGLSTLALDADAEDQYDDSSSENHLEQFKTLSASDRGSLCAESRLVSQTAIFRSNLFAPFKARSPP